MSTPGPVDEIVVHRLPASVDDAWIEHVGPSLRALVGQPSLRVLALDATDLRAIDARGVGLLTALRLLAEERGASVTVRNHPPALTGVLEAARLGARAVPEQSPPASSGPARTDPPVWWTAAASNA